MRVWSLRARLALGAALLTLAVVASSGLLIVVALDSQDRAAVDARLAATVARLEVDASKLLLESNDVDPGTDRPSGDAYGGLLDSSGSLVRLVRGPDVLVERGDIPAVEVPAPSSVGLTTFDIDGGPWRSLVVDAGLADGVRVQVLQDLRPVEQRVAAARQLVLTTTVIATVVAAGGGWLVGSVATRPVRRLRDGARQIRASGRASERLPVPVGPVEIHDLATTLNAMLAQLEASMLATRRFTADAGHELRTPLATLGTYLETLDGASSLERGQIQAMVGAMVIEHRRITALLDGLQTLARGDAGAIPPFGPVEVGEIASMAVRDARRRHIGTTIDLRNEVGERSIDGWAEGLRLALDNLIDNAAIHGRPDGRIEVEVLGDTSGVTIEVRDDGPGIPADQRRRLTERFARGSAVQAPGTGLGLALVEQQAVLHGGSLELDAASPIGGLRATIHLPDHRVATRVPTMSSTPSRVTVSSEGSSGS